MIDSKSPRIKSIKLKKFKSNVNGDITPRINGQKVSNGSTYHKIEENEFNKSWNVMNYQEYLNYRRRHSTSEKDGDTILSSTSEEGGSSPGFIFRFYKKFGFYWNVFPKTDYCYLPGSPDYKKEISPGIPQVPNLSRYPLSSFIDRSVGLKSRNSTGYDSSSKFNLSETSSTKINYTSNSFYSKEGSINVEARQNIINSILSKEQRQSSTWTTIKRVSHTILKTGKRIVVMTFSTMTEAINSISFSNMRVPLLLFVMLLSFLYFFIPGFVQEQKAKVIESIINDENSLTKFISWVFGCFTSVLFLVKDSLLFIPTIFQQLVTFFLIQYDTETSIPNDLISFKTIDEKLSTPSVPISSGFSREMTKEELISIQTGIIEKIKEEFAGQENYMSTRIDRLQEQMKQLTEDVKKISGSFEDDWRDRFNILEEEIKLELADIRKSVDDFGERAVGGFVATPIKLVEKAVAKYHADRTGKPDYALQSSGGYIVRVRCTQMYTKTTAKFYLFGLPLPWDIFNGPDTIIKPGVMPGECWAFEGSFAQVTLHLATKVKVTGFSIEHSPRELALHGHISSAPKQFSVWALDSEEDENPVLLGRFTFLDNGESLQEFEALDYDKAVDLVELKVESNHGHPEYTCLYRFRVHGVPPLV